VGFKERRNLFPFFISSLSILLCVFNSVDTKSLRAIIFLIFSSVFVPVRVSRACVTQRWQKDPKMALLLDCNFTTVRNLQRQQRISLRPVLRPLVFWPVSGFCFFLLGSSDAILTSYYYFFVRSLGQWNSLFTDECRSSAAPAPGPGASASRRRGYTINAFPEVPRRRSAIVPTFPPDLPKFVV